MENTSVAFRSSTTQPLRSCPPLTDDANPEPIRPLSPSQRSVMMQHMERLQASFRWCLGEGTRPWPRTTYSAQGEGEGATAIDPHVSSRLCLPRPACQRSTGSNLFSDIPRRKNQRVSLAETTIAFLPLEEELRQHCQDWREREIGGPNATPLRTDSRQTAHATVARPHDKRLPITSTPPTPHRGFLISQDHTR